MGQAPDRKLAAIGALSSITLAAVLDQSLDCVKLIGLDGRLRYVNRSGFRMMEMCAFDDAADADWTSLWPEPARQAIAVACASAARGISSRFRIACPTRSGIPHWWDVTMSPVADAGGLHTGYLCVIRDVTDLMNGHEALEIVSAEIKHRLKNTYTMVGSLLTAFARGDPGTEAFARGMTDRLGALGTAQSLFLSHEAHCELARLIPALLAPFGHPECPVIIGEQSPAIVDQGMADAIALVLGELSVNSTKHGALGHGGRIRVGSALRGDLLTIFWSEHSSRPVGDHVREGGQGLHLMERIVRTRGGTIAFDWQTAGLAVTMTFPHRTQDLPVEAAA